MEGDDQIDGKAGNDKIYGDYDTGSPQADVVDIPTGVLPEKEKSTYELFLEAFKPKL